MALSTENPNLVWQKAFVSLQALGAKPAIAEQLRKLKERLATVGGNPNLAFVTISDLTADVVGVDAPCKLFAVFLKKQATGTDAFYNVFDDATNDATAGDARISIGLVTASEQSLFTHPTGFDLAAGFVHGSYTALIGSNGSTPSTTGDGPNGFAIVGAP